MIGLTISHYRITEKLGAGGMGEVYLAEDTELDRRVAIKFLPAGFSADAEALDRFKREAKAAAALSHPNIITIYDVGTHDGRPYIVMEHVDGEPLSALIARKDLTIERALEIAVQMFEGLAAAHAAGIVHRDIKPGNIVIDRSGRVRILDFGLAKLMGVTAITAADTAVGTASYMSPEQARGKEVDTRSDLFSAGAVLYEMITGRRAFAVDHPTAVFHAIATETPQPLRRYNNEASDGLERIVSKLMAKDRAARYPGAAGVVVDLRAEQNATAAPVATRPGPHRGIRVGALAIVVVVAAGLFLFLKRDHHRPGKTAIPSPPAAPTAPPAAPRSIAVLPFVNVSDDKSNEYFSDGISEDLLNLLTKIPQLEVTARTSSFAFKGQSLTIPEIAHRLHVAHILEGSVQKVGDRVRITAQLVNATTDTQLWSQNYDRRLDDVFKIQDEIAADVVKELKVTLLGAAPQARETDPRAYALYLKAVQAGRDNTPGAFARSDSLYHRVLAIDPRYVPAWTGLARNFTNEADFGVLSTKQGLARARDAAERALSIDPDYAPAHARLGEIAMAGNDLAGAAKQLERALALDPADPAVLTSAALLLEDLGRMDEALPLEKAIYRRDPVNASALMLVGNAQRRSGQFDAAIESYRLLLSVRPDQAGPHFGLGVALLLKGDAAAALAAFQREPSKLWRQVGLPMAFYALGRKAESDTALAHLVATEARDMSWNIAYVYAFRGDADPAFEWLDKAVTYHDSGVQQVMVENLLDNIHSDPRWLPFLRGIGMAPDQLAKIEFKVTLPEDHPGG